MSSALGNSRSASDNLAYSARQLRCVENGSCSMTIKSTSESALAAPWRGNAGREIGGAAPVNAGQILRQDRVLRYFGQTRIRAARGWQR